MLSLAGCATHDIQFSIHHPENGVLSEIASESESGWQIAAPYGKTGLSVPHIRRYAGNAVAI
jgi:hypothetical protein